MNLSEFVTAVATDIRTLLKLRDKLKGGTAGQVPKKDGPDDFDFSWADAGGGGGSSINLVSDNATFIGEDGTPQQGSHEAAISGLVFDPAFRVDFGATDTDATVRAPQPSDSFSTLGEGDTINATTPGYSHLLTSINPGVPARYTLDASYGGWGRAWRKTLFNGHDAAVEVVVSSAFGGVVARIVGDDGAGAPMLTIPVGGVLTVVPNPNNFKLYAWGDLA